ncbi:MAG: hypothetical protein R2857_10485 [Vampirovibrionales bacterium]
MPGQPLPPFVPIGAPSAIPPVMGPASGIGVLPSPGLLPPPIGRPPF